MTSYDNWTIASTLKIQIRTVQRLRAQLNASDDPLEVVERKDTAKNTRTKEFIEKVQAIIDETPQRPIRQIARDLGENITNMTSHNTKASLIATICRVFAEVPPALVEKACSQFRIRIEAVIEAEGSYIK